MGRACLVRSRNIGFGGGGRTIKSAQAWSLACLGLGAWSLEACKEGFPTRERRALRDVCKTIVFNARDLIFVVALPAFGTRPIGLRCSALGFTQEQDKSSRVIIIAGSSYCVVAAWWVGLSDPSQSTHVYAICSKFQ